MTKLYELVVISTCYFIESDVCRGKLSISQYKIKNTEERNNERLHLKFRFYGFKLQKHFPAVSTSQSGVLMCISSIKLIEFQDGPCDNTR